MGTTNFQYWGARRTASEVGQTTPIAGGQVVYLKATSAIPHGYLVAVDTANALQVVTAPSAADTTIGVCVGYLDNMGFENYSGGPAAGQTAIIQVSGVASCVADSAINVGDRVVSGSVTAGRVKTAVVAGVASGATTVTSTAANGNILTGDGSNFTHIVGKALQGATAAGQAVLVLLHA
jgi:hypothetical protein